MYALPLRAGMRLLPFVLAAVAPLAHAAVTFDTIGINIAANAISGDGTIITGNTGDNYETFRWTEETGAIRLGRSTFDVLGRGAGAPDISTDGTQISATIITEDLALITQGRWTEGADWEVTMPPIPADGGLIDLAYGSAWGISGDGSTVVGLYWRPDDVATGLAHACYWTEATGVVDLGSSGGNSRANDCDADGNVVVGWDERTDGVWQPTVWVDGVLTTLSPSNGFALAECVSDDGTIVGGQVFDDDENHTVATVWRWDGATWVEDKLGSFPGTIGQWGYVSVLDMTPDGSRMVGVNRFGNPGQSTGFIWEAGTGMIDIEDFLTDNGVTIPSNLNILSLTGISDDGMTICGVGQQNVAPFPLESFIITLDSALAVGDGSQVTPSFVRMAPNPTRGATTISLSLPATDLATLDVFDVTGRRVARLLDGAAAGTSTVVSWDGRDAGGATAAPGVYYTRLETAGGHSETHRLVVVR